MKEYISKSALVTEIERLKTDALQKKSQCKRSGLERIMHQIGAYNKILSIINTHEVKEVDLEKEIDKWWWGKTWQTYGMALNPGNIRDFAKHLFELGMQQSKNDK